MVSRKLRRVGIHQRCSSMVCGGGTSSSVDASWGMKSARANTDVWVAGARFFLPARGIGRLLLAIAGGFELAPTGGGAVVRVASLPLTNGLAAGPLIGGVPNFERWRSAQMVGTHRVVSRDAAYLLCPTVGCGFPTKMTLSDVKTLRHEVDVRLGFRIAGQAG
jgi:hypothetical protein